MSSTWKRDLVVIPIIVGAVVALVTYGIPFLFDRGARLSYTVDGPVPYVSETPLNGVTVTVNGQSVDRLYYYRVKLWNSGSTPLKEVPVLYSFEPNENIRVLLSVFRTKPEKEFGSIEEQTQPDGSDRFVYALLNRGDEVSTTFLADAKRELRLFARGEGLVTKKVEEAKAGGWTDFLQFAAVGIAVVASLLTKVLETNFRRLIVRQKQKGSSGIANSQETPDSPSKAGLEDSRNLGSRLEGAWSWMDRYSVTFKRDGTMECSSGNAGNWRWVDLERRIVLVHWRDGPWVDTLTVAPDFRSAEGVNHKGHRVWGARK